MYLPYAAERVIGKKKLTVLHYRCKLQYVEK